MYPSTNLTKSFMVDRIPNINATALPYNHGLSEGPDPFAHYCSIFADTTQPPILTSGHPFLPYRVERQRFQAELKTRATTPPPALHSPVPDKVFVNVPFWLSGEHDWETEVDFSTGISNPSPALDATIATTAENATESVEDGTDDTHSTGTSSFSSSSSQCSFSSFTSTSCTSASIYTFRSAVIARPMPSTNLKQRDTPVADSEALEKASQFAERILELDDVEDSQAKTEEMDRLFKDWQEIYAKIRLVLDVELPGVPAGIAKN